MNAPLPRGRVRVQEGTTLHACKPTISTGSRASMYCVCSCVRARECVCIYLMSCMCLCVWVGLSSYSNLAHQPPSHDPPHAHTRTDPHSQNGVLVDDSTPAALADGIVRLLRNPTLRRELGAEARATVMERYTIEAMVRHYDQLYSQLAETAVR